MSDGLEKSYFFPLLKTYQKKIDFIKGYLGFLLTQERKVKNLMAADRQNEDYYRGQLEFVGYRKLYYQFKLYQYNWYRKLEKEQRKRKQNS